MNATRFKYGLAMGALALLDFGPICFLCLLGVWVTLTRPDGFYGLVAGLYRDTREPMRLVVPSTVAHRHWGLWCRCQALFAFVVLFLLDIAPLPITGFLALYVVGARPPWFKRLIEDIYGLSEDRPGDQL